MSVPTPETVVPTPTPEVVSPPAGDPPKPADPTAPAEDKPLGPNGEKALQAERDARKAAEKAVADALAKVKEFEDRDKSEAERNAEAKSAAEKEAAEARRELLRYKIAAEKQVDAELLSGEDEESMRAHADRLIAWRGEVKPGTPKPDPSQGARPAGADDIDQQIAAATKAGNHRLAISLKRQKAYASKS